MKVLMISKACVTGPYQKKLEEIAAHDDIELRVVVPPYWRTGDFREPLDRQHLSGYEMSVRRALFNGHFHFHFYPGLSGEIDRIGRSAARHGGPIYGSTYHANVERKGGK